MIYGCTGRADLKPATSTSPTSNDLQKGEDLFFSNTKKDSAFYYFTNVTENGKDSLLVAMAYAYMTMIQDDAGDYYGGQESALEGLKHLDEKNPRHRYCLSSIYNELGVSNAGLKNFASAIEYYDLAIKFQDEEANKIIFLNNKAVAHREQGDFKQAIQILELLIKKQKGNKVAYARALTNLESTKWLADPSYNPVPILTNALNIRINEKNNIGIASSYNHLSDYYLKRQRDSAYYYATAMYHIAQTVNSVDQKLDALKKLVFLAPLAESRIYFERYRELNDSVTDARNIAKNQFAIIKYRSEKNKAENLLLQQDNSKKELKILQQKTWFAVTVILVVLTVLLLVLWFIRKKQQLEWRSKVAIQHARLKTSQKVHDVVANGLYRIMNEIEHNGMPEKEQLLDRIEYLYEHSRDISYDPLETLGDFKEKIDTILTSFANKKTIVSIIGNDDKIWPFISPGAAIAIEKVLEELMINMSRHSNAANVVVRFELTENVLTIFYHDNGDGFKPGFLKGNGLKSTETRIHEIGGTISFTSQNLPGASIKIVIPTIHT